MESSYGEVAVINSEELENLPNTQPFDLNSESADSYTADQRIWAYLVPIVDFLPPVALKKVHFLKNDSIIELPNENLLETGEFKLYNNVCLQTISQHVFVNWG